MSRSITELVPGDYVKIGGKFEKITSIYGVSQEGRLEPPSRGGFGVTTENGQTVTMWQAQSYAKKEDIE